MNKVYRKRTVSLILLFFVICATAFILVNSVMDYTTSHSVSGNVADIVTNNKENKDALASIIRKAAHVLEYACLGIPVIIFAMRCRREYKRSVSGFSFFYVLAVAVIDEHMQSYSDRTSSTGDIILDFCGALAGFLAGWLIFELCQAILQRQKNRNSEAK